MQQFVFGVHGFPREFHARKCTLVHLVRAARSRSHRGGEPGQVTFRSFRAGSSGG
jgi:hypothetical protein